MWSCSVFQGLGHVRCYSYVMIIHFSSIWFIWWQLFLICVMVYSNVSRAWRLTTSQRRFLLKIVGAGFFFLVLEATFDLQRILQQFLSAVVAPNLRRVLFGRRNRRRGFGDFVTCQLVVFWLRSQFGWGESHRRHVIIFFSRTRIIASSGSHVFLTKQFKLIVRSNSGSSSEAVSSKL